MAIMFGVLGPVRLRRGTRLAPAAGRMQSILLGVLLARVNGAVPVDVLIEAMWGAPDPRSAQRLQLHVHRLRRVLDDPDRLTFHRDAYRLRADADELDATRFELLVHDGRPESLREALRLWQGEPYQGLDVPLLTDEAARLTERRLAAEEDRYAAELAAGRATSVVTDLAELVRAHPLRERAHLLHVTALYEAGRRADALRAYRCARDALVVELGVEPGFELRALEARVLAGDPVTGWAGPAQLPKDVPAFVGRDDAMAAMAAAWARRAGPLVVAGTAGVGKTALAVRWAHRNRESFPDGQLYVDLHGFGPGRPLVPADVLAGFLRALGVPGAAAPTDPVELAARFRSLVHDRKVLVLLDNAHSVAQVRPLLPAGPDCFVVVTSRDSLAGLVARDGAARVDLDRLPPAEASDLVRRLVGARADAEHTAVGELVDRCARLPLALRIAAEAVGIRAGLRVTDVVADLDLDVLDATGDPGTDIRAVFSWSHRHLDDDAARLFRLMGRHPWDAPPDALGALAGFDGRTTRRALASLARAHLVEESAGGRFGMHDLLRAYAAEQQEPDAGAVRRLFAWYVRSAAAARFALIPQSPEIPMTGVPEGGSSFPDAAAALAWFDAERPVLVALVTSGRDDDLAWRLAAMLLTYFNIGKHWGDWLTTHEAALAAARRVGSELGEALVLNGLGVVHDDLAHDDEAVACHVGAEELYARVDAPHCSAWNLNNLGVVYDRLGRFDEAAAAHHKALDLFRSVGDQRGVGYSLNNLGDVYRQRGEYAAAETNLLLALALQTEVGEVDGLRYTYAHLADLYWDAGRPADAREWYDKGVTASFAAGDRWLAAKLLTRLAVLGHEPGDRLRQAHALFHEVGDTESADEVRELLLSAG
ncbi:AfsR/SARP family transcriptional regulator [Actinophytocola glycyrrhizae]|uniref:BTAD domain-containing putative transcriptional regulator n=1 Tax=Actinophytocola glycyrrhizae TaxID=2044873 RepID=A0ABV9S535_9PSEU